MYFCVFLYFEKEYDVISKNEIKDKMFLIIINSNQLPKKKSSIYFQLHGIYLRHTINTYNDCNHLSFFLLRQKNFYFYFVRFPCLTHGLNTIGDFCETTTKRFIHLQKGDRHEILRLHNHTFMLLKITSENSNLLKYTHAHVRFSCFQTK